MFAIRDRAAATRIMTLVTRKSSWPKRSAELVPSRSSVSFTYLASFFSSLDPLSQFSHKSPFFFFNFILEILHIERVQSIDTLNLTDL